MFCFLTCTVVAVIAGIIIYFNNTVSTSKCVKLSETYSLKKVGQLVQDTSGTLVCHDITNDDKNNKSLITFNKFKCDLVTFSFKFKQNKNSILVSILNNAYHDITALWAESLVIACQNSIEFGYDSPCMEKIPFMSEKTCNIGLSFFGCPYNGEIITKTKLKKLQEIFQVGDEISLYLELYDETKHKKHIYKFDFDLTDRRMFPLKKGRISKDKVRF